MSSINSKTNADVMAAFNKLGQDAATNDDNMSATVKADAAALADDIANDSELSSTDKKALSDQVAALLPMAGEAGHGAEWNADMQTLVNQLSALPEGAAPDSSAHQTVFDAYNTLNNLVGTGGGTGGSEAVQTATQALLTAIQNDSSLSATQQQDLESQVTNLLPIAGKDGHAAEWNQQFQTLHDSLLAIAQASSGGPSTGGPSTGAPGTTEASYGGPSTGGGTSVPPLKGAASLSDTVLYPGGNGPTLLDIQQGNLTDCTIDAALSSLVQNNPSAITDMISSNGDGTYDVTLYPDGVKKTFTIDPNKDLLSGGTTGKGGKPDWASIIEAAAAQTDFPINNTDGAEPGAAMELLTGTGQTANQDKTQTTDFGSADDGSLEASLSSALASGKLIMAGASSANPNPVNGETIAANHAYAVLAVQDGMVTVRNPWSNQDNNGIIQMTVAQYAQYFDETFVQD